MQYATDVVAVIFVADASAYDVVKFNGVDAATGQEIYSNKLLETLDSFKKMWMNPMLKKKSVILLLNKQDLLEVSCLSCTLIGRLALKLDACRLSCLILDVARSWLKLFAQHNAFLVLNNETVC